LFRLRSLTAQAPAHLGCEWVIRFTWIYVIDDAQERRHWSANLLGKIEGRGTRGHGEPRLHKVCGGTPFSTRVPSHHDFARLAWDCGVPSTLEYA